MFDLKKEEAFDPLDELLEYFGESELPQRKAVHILVGPPQSESIDPWACGAWVYVGSLPTTVHAFYAATFSPKSQRLSGDGDTDNVECKSSLLFQTLFSYKPINTLQGRNQTASHSHRGNAMAHHCYRTSVPTQCAISILLGVDIEAEPMRCRKARVSVCLSFA